MIYDGVRMGKWRYRLSDWLEALSWRVRPKPKPMTMAEMIEAQRVINRHMSQQFEAMHDGDIEAARIHLSAHRVAFDSALGLVRDDLSKRDE